MGKEKLRMSPMALWLIISVFFIMVCKVDSKLIDSILEQDQPDRFPPRDVSLIVAHYIPIGTEKQEAIYTLKQHGLDVKEEQRKIEKCPTCNAMVVMGSYTERQWWPPFFPAKSFISIMLGCKDRKIAHIAASHSGNPF